MKEILYIVVPAYNEAANIRNLVRSWYPIIRKLNEQRESEQNGESESKETQSGGESRLVVINDGSRDETYEILKQMESEYPYLTALTKPNEGHGPTLLFGYRYALEQGADFVFQTDSDGQTNPREFGRFWKLRHKYEALFGNRIRRGDGISRDFVEKVLCFLLFLFFQVRVPDANAPFRLMRRSYLERYLPKIPKDYNLPNVMLVTFGVREHRSVRFLPVSFRPRQGGKNSVDMRKIVRIGMQALKDFRAFRSAM